MVSQASLTSRTRQRPFRPLRVYFLCMRRLLAVLTLMALSGLVACSSGSSSSGTTGGSSGTSTGGSALDRVRSALGSKISSDLAVGDSQVRSVSRSGRLLDIVLTTPGGGFQGPSTKDADALASAAFAKAFQAGWSGPASVEFDGGLASRATGKDLPNAEAFGYRVNGGEATQIDWTDEQALFSIDWSLYRTFCHPAFKGCS